MEQHRKTLRLKFLHEGNRNDEKYRLESIRRTSWENHLASPSATMLGEYRWILENPDDGGVIASAGYSPLFAEWRTTSWANGPKKESFVEYFYIPETGQISRFKIQGRNADNEFFDLFQMVLTPPVQEQGAGSCSASMFAAPKIMDILNVGFEKNRVKILLLSEGYAGHEETSFRTDSHEFARHLFSREPYRSRKKNFSIRAVFIASEDTGISDLSTGKLRKTAFSAAYGSLGIDRYLLPHDMNSLHAAAGFAPWNFLVVLCNSDKYGGGGLFNQFACYAAKSKNLEYLIPHEFSHCFAALADEYYTAHVTYQIEHGPLTMPWEPNVSKIDSSGKVKWSHLISFSTPVPTPWDKTQYEELMLKRHEAMREKEKKPAKLSRKELDEIDSEAKALLERQTYSGTVGAFEGAWYRSKNIFRPEVDCIMFSKTSSRFCRVCNDSIVRTIERYSRHSQQRGYNLT